MGRLDGKQQLYDKLTGGRGRLRTSLALRCTKLLVDVVWDEASGCVVSRGCPVGGKDRVGKDRVGKDRVDEDRVGKDRDQGCGISGRAW